MKVDTTFLRSKVAKRIFVLFICCALLPITAMAVISFSQVTHQLNEQNQRRLRQTSKAVGMSIYDRLLFLDAEMKMIASNVQTDRGLSPEASIQENGQDLTHRFTNLVLVSEGGRSLNLIGQISPHLQLTDDEQQHVRAGRTLVSVRERSSLTSRILMSQALDLARPGKGFLLGEVDPTYLWDIGEDTSLPYETDLVVLGQSHAVIVGSKMGLEPFSEPAPLILNHASSGHFDWQREGETYLAGFWSLPLKFRFFTPNWTVVLSEPKAAVLAPLANFTYTFCLVVLISLCIVALLSISQIRRSLVPLEKLRQGTQRIARKDFASRVDVSSGDEFEELAHSFNTMASRLGRQFHTLATMTEIELGILSALDTENIVETVLRRIRDAFPCDYTSVTLCDSDETSSARFLQYSQCPRRKEYPVQSRSS